jgi:hypothetical protein
MATRMQPGKGKLIEQEKIQDNKEKVLQLLKLQLNKNR